MVTCCIVRRKVSLISGMAGTGAMAQSLPTDVAQLIHLTVSILLFPLFSLSPLRLTWTLPARFQVSSIIVFLDFNEVLWLFSLFAVFLL